MRADDYVRTPRFCNVKIRETFASVKEMRRAGYTEPTYYQGEYEVLGRSIDMYHMEFAAARKEIR